MKLRALIGMSAGHVVQARLLDHPAQQVAQGEPVGAGHRRDGREADVAALLAAVPAGHVVPLEVGHAALDALGRVLEVRDVLGRALGAPDLGALDRGEGRLDLGEAVVDDRLVAVEREAHAPAPDLELAGHRVEDVVGDRPVAPATTASRSEKTEPSRTVLRICGTIRIGAVEHQRAQDVEDRRDVVVLPHPQPQRHVDLGVGHQPDAHLRDDPVVGLHEELVGRRARGRACRRARTCCRASRPCRCA